MFAAFRIPRNTFSLLASALFLLSLPNLVFAQWEEAQRLTDGTDSSITSAWGERCLLVNEGIVHVAWEDNRNGYWQVFYKRSTDEGETWSRDFPCSADEYDQDSHRPAMAVAGETVHLVWYGVRDGSNEIYYRRSANAGKEWEPVQRLTDDSAVRPLWPVIAVNGDEIHVAWSDAPPGMFYAAYYMKSIDGGETWQEERRMTAEHHSALGVQVSVEGSSVYLGWYYYGGAKLSFSSYLHSTDGGESWAEECNLLEDPLIYSSGLNIQQSGSHVFMVWSDKRTGSFDIYCRHSSDGGLTWGDDVPYLNRQLNFIYPFIAVRGSVVYLAFVDDANGLGQLKYSRSTNCGVDWSEWVELSSYTARARFPHLALGENAVHALWTEIEDDTVALYYSRNPNGVVTPVEPTPPIACSALTLDPVYPNPLRASGTMEFTLPTASQVRISLHDMRGRELRSLIDGWREPGRYSLRLDGSRLPAGSYICRVQADGRIVSRVLTVLHE
jgi:hypothetical protein